MSSKTPKQGIVNGLVGLASIFLNTKTTGWAGFFGLFFENTKFIVHKVNGMLYLLFLVVSAFQLAFNYEKYKNGPLPLLLPLSGFLQAIIAAFSFSFLPKGAGDVQGYYSDKRTITYDFLLENIYFSGLLLFQCVYAFTNVFQERLPPVVGYPLEALLVFLPYACIRMPFFAKTSFGKSNEITSQYTSDKTRILQAFSVVSKMFYVWSKHNFGYYLNYLIFLGMLKDDPVNMRILHINLVFAGWGTTIAMFLHTLKFRRVISAPTALLLYTGSFPFMFVNLLYIQWAYASQLWVILLVLAGVVMNFLSRDYGQYIFQFGVLAYLWQYRQTMSIASLTA